MPLDIRKLTEIVTAGTVHVFVLICHKRFYYFIPKVLPFSHYSTPFYTLLINIINLIM